MPDTDVTYAVAQKLKPLVQRVKAIVKSQVYAGPGAQVLTAKEALARLQAMTPEQRLALLAKQGEDAFMDNTEQLLEEVARSTNAGR